MANSNAPRGLIPVSTASGTPYSIAPRRYRALASYATALFIGDAVVKVAGGADTDGVPLINVATPGSGITGVVVGFEDPASMQLGYGAASTLRNVLVDDNPETLYEIQEDAVGGTLAVADVGLNANLIAAAGSTAFRTSGWMLDTSTKATTDTLDLKIIGFQERADNEVAVANSKVLVKINNHTQRNGAAGI